MEQLNAYILQARQRGQSDEQIHQALVAAGWDTNQVNSALGITQTPGLAQHRAHNDNKKSKMVLTLIGGVAVLVLAIGGTYALLGHNTHKSVPCSSQSCFQQKFASCSPATLNNATTTGIRYAINGPKGAGCSMTVEYAYNPNPAWKNQPMTCIFNDKESYNEVVFNAFTGLAATSNPDSCTGPLVALLESQ